MRNSVRAAGAAALALTLFGTVAACGATGEPDSSQSERDTGNSGYDALVAAQPAHTMQYSPTRNTKNFWIDTWGKPGKLSFVYLQSSDGRLLGYYVLEGLPVNYCTSLTPPFDINASDYGKVVVPRPSVDGTWSGGGSCNTYYGKDATTGTYIEYTAGLGINVLLYDQPIGRQAEPLGKTRIEDLPK